HQPASFGKLTLEIYCRDRVAGLKLDQLDAPADEKGIAADQEGVGALAHKRCESRIDLSAGAGVENLDLQSHGASSRFRFSHNRGHGTRSVGRIDEYGNASSCRY